MIIKEVRLTNFRNHSSYVLECTDETSLILGKNGCGKTSVLEAIYILMRGKSFRAVDAEILKRGEEYYRVELELTSGEKNVVTFDGENKTFLILDKKTRRLPKKNKYPVVLFLPSDLNLISGSPAKRRDYFDRVFGQFDERYDDSLSKYNKALKQRNELLKRENLRPQDVFSWNMLLARYGSEIFKYRQIFIDEINQTLTSVYRSIAENEDDVELTLNSEVSEVSEEKYLKQLEMNLVRDNQLGYTSFGVHRDDFIFKFNENEAEGSASRGEMRSMILALKFIEADLIYKKTGLRPVVLLDDVFSELDKTRKNCLLKNFKNNHVINFNS